MWMQLVVEERNLVANVVEEHKLVAKVVVGQMMDLLAEVLNKRVKVGVQ
jgi:hypothetical protein